MTTTTSSEEGYVDLDGVRTYHEITGAGEPLVLLHGGMCTIAFNPITMSFLVRQTAEIHFLMGAAMRAGGQVEHAPGERDDIVAADDPQVAAGDQEFEVPGRLLPGGLGVLGLDGEATVEAFEETRQVGLCGLDRTKVVHQELFEQPVLQRAPQAFDAAFGLRRPRLDVPDAPAPAACARRAWAPGRPPVVPPGSSVDHCGPGC